MASGGDELLSLLSQFEQSGGNINDPSIPQDLQELLRTVTNKSGKPADDVPTEEITPEAGFVVKTTDSYGRKVFVNVCHSARVASPGGWTNNAVPLEVKEALKNADNLSPEETEALRFPLSTGEPRADYDWKGEACTTVDVIFNTDVIKQAASYRPLKTFLVQLAMGWISQKHKLDLTDEYKLPKMRYKGDEVQPQRIKMDKKPLVTEVQDVFEEPQFPLLFSKPVGTTSKSKTSSQIIDEITNVRDQNNSTPKSGRRHLEGAKTAAKAVQPLELAEIQYKVEYVGRPVDRMIINVPLPAASAISPDGIKVNCCGRIVAVSISGFNPIEIELPFAVDSSQSRVRLMLDALLIELKYMPVEEFLKIIRSQKPHAFGSLKLENRSYMELEA